MDALILAGGELSPELISLTSATSKERALLPVAGRPMLAYVYEALRGAQNVERIFVACGPDTTAQLGQIASDAHALPDAGTMMKNAVAGSKAIGGRQAIICTCDVPCATPADVEELIAGTKARNLEGVYSIARRETMERDFPGGTRTYAPIREGRFTAGNAVVAPGGVVERMNAVFEMFYQARKNPLKMARVLGPGFLFKAVTRTLTVAEAERKVSRLLGARCGALEINSAGLAWDVDKPEHLAQAEAFLNRRGAEPQR